MDVSFSSSISGIRTAITRQDITAHDVANVNTRGFEQRTALQTDVQPEGVRLSAITRTPNSPGAPSNTDLAEEATEQIVNKGSLSANIQVLKAKDKMVGELLDLLA
jgi:flagellar basal-body rod protein FlgC